MIQISKKEKVQELLKKYHSFIFDLDGVVWKGGVILPHVEETIELLCSLKSDNSIFFYSNATHRSQKTMKQRLKTCLKGISETLENLDSNHFLCPNVGISSYLKECSIEKEGNIFIIGRIGIEEQLKDEGFKGCYRLSDLSPYADHDEFIRNYLPLAKRKHEAVIFCYDFLINSLKLSFFLLILQFNPQCKILLSDGDSTFPWKNCLGGEDSPKMIKLPGTFSFWKTIENATTRKDFKLIGKPSTFVLDMLLKEKKELKKEEILYIGDSLECDIKMCNAAKVDSLLVLSGMTQLKDLENSEIRPTYVIKEVGEIFSLTR